MGGRLPEAYQWLLVPVQSTPEAAIEWQALRLAGQDPLAVRVSKKLRSEELLVPVLAGTRLRMELDRVPLWRGDHVEIRQLADHFARYLYLPRLADPEVLIRAIQDGLGLLLWRENRSLTPMPSTRPPVAIADYAVAVRSPRSALRAMDC